MLLASSSSDVNARQALKDMQASWKNRASMRCRAVQRIHAR